MYPASLLMSAEIGSSPHDPPLYICHELILEHCMWKCCSDYGNREGISAGFLLPSKFQNHVQKGLYRKKSDLIVMLNKRSGAPGDTKETF